MLNKKTDEGKEEIVLRLFNENKAEPNKTTFEETIKVEYPLVGLIQEITDRKKFIKDKKEEIKGNKDIIKLEEKRIDDLQRRLDHPEVVKIVKALEEKEASKKARGEDITDAIQEIVKEIDNLDETK